MDELITREGLRVVLREIRAGDVALHEEFIAALDPEDLRFRFGNRIVEAPHSRLRRMMAVDHDNELTVVAVVEAATGVSEIVGEIRLQEDVDGATAEFAIAVRTSLQRQGLGRALLEKAVEICRERKLRLLYGLVDRSNTAMIELARRLRFEVDEVPAGATVVVTRDLTRDGPSS
jgi:acetyltransferase